MNIPTIVFTTTDPQELRTTVLGVPLEFLVEPTQFDWHFGESPASRLTTEEPGAGYPNQTITHTYTSKGTHTISLTAAWSGKFRPVGSATWVPVTGQARTTAEQTIDIVEARARLVDK